MNLAIIGGGASGLMAALTAAKRGACVTVFEKKEQVGKKLSVTGNGHCNYSNFYMAKRYYRGHHTEFADSVIHTVTPEDLTLFFESIGMLSFAKETYLYPSTFRAETVVSVLLKACKEAGVRILTDTEVTGISKKDNAFLLTSKNGNETFDRVILSMGSEASVHDKTPFLGYSFLDAFKIHRYPSYPSLVGLCGQNGFEDLWDGVRFTANVSFTPIEGDTEEDTGEVQFAKDGLSGIPILQISHTVTEELMEHKKPVTIVLNFLPGYDEKSLFSFLNEKRNSNSEESVASFLDGWIPKKLVSVLLNKKAIPEKRFSECTYEDIEKTVSSLTHFPYIISSVRDITTAHASQGGCDTDEVSSFCEVKRIPGLFITGELLDIDGLCGGYNLHFAFATGKIAGEAATKDIL